MKQPITNPLPQQFYEKPTLDLAAALLGCLLVKQSPEGVTAGYIVETEAYIGPGDKAAHSYNNRRTKRTEIMFHKSGLAYTYLMHTHCLFNVVSGGEHNPQAVLVRAIEPAVGLDLMSSRRLGQTGTNLTNGPGKLTKAMGITMEDYGHALTSSPLFITAGKIPGSISAGKRIGIDNSEEARDYPWRYWITGNPFVSRHQKGQPIKRQ
jgi:DNA-3-methyladenine glycosylase